MLDADEVRELLARLSRGPRRSLGQNFVTDPSTIAEMVRRSGVGAGSRVLEVGPGLGSLTIGLLEAGAEVVAIEKDPELRGMLPEVIDPRHRDRMTLHLGDALAVDWGELLDGGGWSMVSNLPYNVAVPILLRVLGAAPMVEELCVMVQSEVAERLCAQPGGRTIGVPTLKVAWYAEAHMIMDVPPEAFTPVPKVTSAVVRIRRRGPPRSDVDPFEVFPLIEAAYRKRRKMLRTSLAGRVADGCFERSGVDQRCRPEELSVGDWANLAAARLGRATVREGGPGDRSGRQGDRSGGPGGPSGGG